MIYLDHQATTPLGPGVLDAMIPYFERDFANPHSSDHAMGWRASDGVEEARGKISAVLGCEPSELRFTSGATESNNLAIAGVCGASPTRRRRLVVSAVEHKSVLGPYHAASLRGYDLVVVPVDARGVVDVDAMEDAVDDDTLIVSLMAVNNEVGSAQPVSEVARICRSRGAIVHCDASQALSWMALDVDALGVDLLSVSAHKAGGPKGVGAIFVRRDVERHVEPPMRGGAQEGGLRPGTLPVPLCVGFGLACTLLPGPEAVDRWRATTARLLAGLRELVPDLRINGVPDHPGSINVRFPGYDAQALILRSQPGLAVAQGSACASGISEPSHVLTALGLSAEEASESIRFSPGVGTTVTEVDEALRVFRGALRSRDGGGVL